MFERVAPEQFDTLPDIPEPAENPLLLGHRDVADMLAEAYRAGKLHHAILLAGPQGIGKATLAFHLAHHLLAHPDRASAPSTLAAPDPASHTFRLIAQGAHPSLLHLTRPYVEKDKKFKTVITVEEIRRVNRFLSMTSHDGGYRVVIVDPADDMNNSAANALLKSLEEPPPATIFVLIAHSLGRLLPTIRSRCQVIRLKPLDSDALLSLLEQLGANLPGEPEACAALIEGASGSPRNAVLMTEYGGLEIAEIARRLIEGSSFDIAEAHRLGEAVTGREKAVQFLIFNRGVLELISDRAAALAGKGEIVAANRMSELWDEVNNQIRDAEIYNLDRKQHVVGLLHRLQAAFARETVRM